MDKVLRGVLVKGIPAELVGDLVELGGPEMRCFGDREGGEVLMGAGGENAVEPCLSVLVSWGSEGCAAELFGIKSEGRFLRGIAERMQCS